MALLPRRKCALAIHRWRPPCSTRRRSHLIVVFLASSDDIALIKPNQPVSDVIPVTRCNRSDEAGQIITLIGIGTTATGDIGHDPSGTNRAELRRAFNKVTSAYDRWFCHVFDATFCLGTRRGSGKRGQRRPCVDTARQ